jgi:SET domain-containing protein
MIALAHDAHSWFSPSVEICDSTIEGKGLFAKKYIKKDEVVALKGGHTVNQEIFESLSDACRRASLQLSESTYLSPINDNEIPLVMNYINHSCEPNVGLHGQLTTVAMRDIKVGEELTGDYCVAYSNTFFEITCHCREVTCRKKITSTDWLDPILQKKYKGYFCNYVENRIRSNVSHIKISLA